MFKGLFKMTKGRDIHQVRQGQNNLAIDVVNFKMWRESVDTHVSEKKSNTNSQLSEVKMCQCRDDRSMNINEYLNRRDPEPNTTGSEEFRDALQNQMHTDVQMLKNDPASTHLLRSWL